MIDIIFYACLGVFVAHFFEPLAWFKNHVYRLLGYPGWFEYLYCSKCVTFWLTLIISKDIKYAVISCFIAFIIDYLLTLINNNQDGE